MTQKTFIKGMSIIKSVYLDWRFDLNDPQQVQVWYSILYGIADDEFLRLVKTLCSTRIKAPSAPAEFFQLMVAEEEAKFISPTEAFNRVLNLIREHGFVYGASAIYGAIESNPALFKTVKEMESELRELRTDDEYTPERFRKAYRFNVAYIAEKRKNERIKNGMRIEENNRRRIAE